MAEATTDLVSLDSQPPGILPGMSSLEPLKQVGILIAIAASIALGVFIALWSNDPPMRPLPSLQAEASMDVINYLEQQQIPYKVGTDGKILVPQSQYNMIKIELGSQGVSIQDQSTTSYLDKEVGFGVSQRMEKARLLRSQERELKNTLEQFSGVRAVKVHLAIPKESSFIKNRRKPSASILLNLYSRGAISDETSGSMVDLIAGSIPNLERSRVTITDQYGRLYHSGSMSSKEADGSRELNIIRDRQAEIKDRIEQLLTPIVGVDAYTVQVNVDMDFTRKEQTMQTFNPDLPAIRSERTIEDTRDSGVAQGVPGALSNQPPGASVIPETTQDGEGNQRTSNRNQRLEAERNYDLDTTISHIIPQVGIIDRISVSIGLNYVSAPATDAQGGSQTGNARVARSNDDLDRIRRLIQASIGFNVQRGDVVSVESFPFVTGEILPDPEPLAFHEQALFQTLLKPMVGLILGILIIFMVLKPAFKNLSKVPAPINAPISTSENEANYDSLGGELGGDLGSGLDNAGSMLDDKVTLAGNENLELPPPTVGEVKKLEQAKSVVENNPTLVAQLVKGWLEEENA
ncbi:MAG: flagellar M-ring protein FliF [Gammaproteobacteria bacterium]|nr:MAG: flagellar M-ring protein FliF [Gammaproteobacteria bacterium]